MIVDGLVQSGGTLSSAKLLATHGAKHVSAYVTRGSPKSPGGGSLTGRPGGGAKEGFRYFWLTDCARRRPRRSRDKALLPAVAGGAHRSSTGRYNTKAANGLCSPKTFAPNPAHQAAGLFLLPVYAQQRLSLKPENGHHFFCSFRSRSQELLEETRHHEAGSGRDAASGAPARLTQRRWAAGSTGRTGRRARPPAGFPWRPHSGRRKRSSRTPAVYPSTEDLEV